MFSLFQKTHTGFAGCSAAASSFFNGDGIERVHTLSFKQRALHVSPNSKGANFIAQVRGDNPVRHWVIYRVSAIFLIPSLLIFLFWLISSVQSHYFDVFNVASMTVLLTSLWVETSFWIKIYLFVLFAILLIHLGEGNENIIQDYIHHEKTKTFCFFLIKCVQIESLKYLYLFIVF